MPAPFERDTFPESIHTESNLPARALVIRFAPAQRYGQSILPKPAILDIERNQFRPSKRARESQQGSGGQRGRA